MENKIKTWRERIDLAIYQNANLVHRAEMRIDAQKNEVDELRVALRVALAESKASHEALVSIEHAALRDAVKTAYEWMYLNGGGKGWKKVPFAALGKAMIAMGSKIGGPTENG